MKWAAILAAAMAATACGAPAASTPSLSPSATASVATPSAAPLSGPFALTASGGTGGHVAGAYYLNLVGLDGHPPAGNLSGYAQNFRSQMPADGSGTPPTALPFVSVSRGRIYYLDGDTTVRYVGVDGSQGIATLVPGGRSAAAVFAVSPDDKRIAVSVLDYSSTPVRLRIYVEDLHGGANHVEIFSSTSVAEWPVGWHAGSVVVAIGSAYSGTDAPNPYEATGGYQVIDPATGNRIAALGSASCQVIGPLTSAGTACVDSGGLHLVDWSGATTNFGGSGMVSGALSPDGTTIAACCQAGGGEAIVLFKRDGTSQPSHAAGRFVAWMDRRTLITGSSRFGPFTIVNLETGSIVSQVPGTDFEGVFPADLG